MCYCLLLSWLVDCFLLDDFQSHAASRLCLLSCFWPASRMDLGSVLEPYLLILTGPWILFITMPCLGVSVGPVAILRLFRSCGRTSWLWAPHSVGLLLGPQLSPALRGALVLLVPAVAVMERCSLSLGHQWISTILFHWFKLHRFSITDISEERVSKTQILLPRLS